MTFNQKQEFYKSFDKEGLKLQPKALVLIDLSAVLGGASSDGKLIYVPQNDTINLTDAEIGEMFVDYIYETTNVNIESINNIDKFQSLNGFPFLLKLEDGANNLSVQLAFGKINGSVTFRDDSTLVSLGNIEEINGDLGFIATSISSLGKLKKVTGSMWIAQQYPYTKLETLDQLEEVGGDLNLKSSPTKTLNKLKSVGGTLNLRKTDIQSFGELKYVGNHIYLPKSKKDVFDFSNIEIKGQVKYFAN